MTYYTEIKSEVEVTEGDTRQLQETVAAILGRVRHEGDAAVRDFEKQFDNFNPPSYAVSNEDAAKAVESLPPEVIEELDYAIHQVRTLSEAQKACMTETEIEPSPGMVMGHRLVPIDSCGCYVPAGRYPCLTSAVMTVIPAQVAGVRRIVVCSPPGKDGQISAGILYTLHKMGVDEIYCMGGAQAIGAMAYGTETIDPVDLIVGPGNQYVMEAKRQVFGQVGIDFLAGPSECMVIADQTGRADYIAADLIAQCEHDTNARGALVCTSEKLARETLQEIDVQLSARTTEETARASWDRKGRVIVVETIEDATRYANEYAPEHLEVHTASPRDLLPLLTNYGSLFLGENTAEVYADKIAGPNHVLPTGRAARYTGGLWVGMYLKSITHMETDVAASVKLARHTVAQSTFEGMDGHRFAAAIRLDNLAKD
jgi:sulfopropanediol 3-dehydrogenase